MVKNTEIAEMILIIAGIFLVIDSLFLHLISFNYTSIGLGFLDSWFDHWMLGVFLIIIGSFGLLVTKRSI